MRLSLAKAVVPVGWPPLEETMQKVVAKKIQILPVVRAPAPAE